MTKQDKKKLKQEKLAQALRDNLRRRKEQDIMPAKDKPSDQNNTDQKKA